MEFLQAQQVAQSLQADRRQYIRSQVPGHSQWSPQDRQPTPHLYLTLSNMIIKITATLNDDEINILANQKYYQDTIMSPVEKEVYFDAYI